MSVRPIVQYPSAKLRAPAAAVADGFSGLLALLEDLKETMWAAEGVGLAAVQIGVPLQICVIDIRDKGGPLIEAVNPAIIEESADSVRQPEGCLSVCPGETAIVTRGARVRVAYSTPDGQRIESEASGLLARAWLHEVDHLMGKTYVSRLGLYDRQRIEKACAKNAKFMGKEWVPGASRR